MHLRYGDKPVEAHRPEETLPELERKQQFAQTKVDGWFTFVVRDKNKTIAEPTWGLGKDGSLFFLSRRDKDKGGPTQIPVCPEIIEGVEKLDLPDQTMYTTEWMKRRTVGEIPETLFFHDILWHNNKWMGDTNAWDRYKKVSELELTGRLAIPDTVETGFLEFYNKQKDIPWTEGVVVKHKSGKLKGDTHGCIKNGMLIKIKWRSGFSGRDVV